MRNKKWFQRLGEQLPGWHVWTSGRRQWYAVPAPADATHAETLKLPNRIDAVSPIELRSLARERYGWDDYCQSCGVLARECGHRQPETVTKVRATSGTRRRDHYPRDNSICPNSEDCERFLHPQLFFDDCCECCGEVIKA